MTYVKMHQAGDLPIPKKSKVYFLQSRSKVFDYDLNHEVNAWHDDTCGPNDEPAKSQVKRVFEVMAHINMTEQEKLNGDNTNIFVAGVC